MEIIYSFIVITLFIFIYRQFVPRKRVFKYPWLTTYFAHRGLYAKDQSVAENSMSAFSLAKENNYGIELDISLSKDNELMVFHDDDLNRMCGINQIISEMDSNELKGIRLKDTEDFIPCLSDVFNLIKGSVPLMIELKTNPNRKKTVTLLKEQLKNYQGNICVVSFDPLILWEVKRQLPYVLIGQVVEDFKYNEKLSKPVRIILNYACLNFLVRPDFLSFKIQAINWVYKLHIFMKGFGALWAINSLDCEKKYQNLANLIIFEHFRP